MPRPYQWLMLQKRFLYENGAGLTLFYLGEIPKVYKSIHKEISENIDRKILKDNFELIFKPREEEAISCAKEAAIKQLGELNNATIILMFGKAHNFLPYCEKEEFELETINTVQQQEKTKRIEPQKIRSDAPITMFFNNLNLDDIEETAINIGNISVAIKKCDSTELQPYRMVVLQDNIKKIGMFLTPKSAYKIKDAMKSGTHALIDTLNTMGQTASNISELLKSQDIQASSNFT